MAASGAFIRPGLWALGLPGCPASGGGPPLKPSMMGAQQGGLTALSLGGFSDLTPYPTSRGVLMGAGAVAGPPIHRLGGAGRPGGQPILAVVMGQRDHPREKMEGLLKAAWRP